MYLSPAIILSFLLATANATLTIEGKPAELKKGKLPTLENLVCDKLSNSERSALKTYLDKNPEQIAQLQVNCVKELTTMDQVVLLQKGRSGEEAFVAAVAGLDLSKEAHKKMAAKLASEFQNYDEITAELVKTVYGVIKKQTNYKNLVIEGGQRWKDFLAIGATKKVDLLLTEEPEDKTKEAEELIAKGTDLVERIKTDRPSLVKQAAKTIVPIWEQNDEELVDIVDMLKKSASDDKAVSDAAVEKLGEKAENIVKMGSEAAVKLLEDEKNMRTLSSLIEYGRKAALSWLAGPKSEKKETKKPNAPAPKLIEKKNVETTKKDNAN